MPVTQGSATVERNGSGPYGLPEPERVQRQYSVGREADSGAGLPWLGRPFEHCDLVSRPVDGQCCRQPTQARSDHDDVHPQPLYACRDRIA
ncbi:hypothetical protein GCM10010464_29890 [Pseudonocardia yunnanensis]